MHRQRMKLKDVVNDDDFHFAASTFLDDFKKTENRYDLVKDEPNGGVIDDVNRCLLAAITHKLCNEYGLTPPSWVNSPIYILPYPVFAHNTTDEEFQRYLIETTPLEFSSRNIFYGANVTSRV